MISLNVSASLPGMPSQWLGSTTEKSPALTARIAASSALSGSTSELDFAAACARRDFDTATVTSRIANQASQGVRKNYHKHATRSVHPDVVALRLRPLMRVEAVAKYRIG